MKKSTTLLSLVLLGTAMLILCTSCAQYSMEKNEILVYYSDVMGEDHRDWTLFQSVHRIGKTEDVAFPETMKIKMPDGSEEEGVLDSDYTHMIANMIPYSIYKLPAKSLRVEVTENGIVHGIEKADQSSYLKTSEHPLSETDFIARAKEVYLQYFGKEISEDYSVSVNNRYTLQGELGGTSVAFTKETEGYCYASGINVTLTLDGEMLRISDKIQLLAGKTIPSGFSENVEKLVDEWIVDKTATYQLSQKYLTVSREGQLLARVFVELTPLEEEPFGVTVLIPLE